MKFQLHPKRYDDVTTLDAEDLICYCCEVDKATIEEAIAAGADTLGRIKERTGACTGNECKEKNPNRRCCSKEIKQLISIMQGV